MDKCDQEVFSEGCGVAAIDACPEVAEAWCKALAAESGQRVDWHYSGGVASVLYLGDHEPVSAAVDKLAHLLEAGPPRKPGDECHGCPAERHLPGRILRRFGPGQRGLHRLGDEVPEGALAVDTSGIL